jgi:RNA polymerase sigma-70 factor (ECF subfamily)
MPEGDRSPYDDELMEQLCRRDAAAFEVLYDRHKRLVRATAHRVIRDAQMAEDISQEVFLRLWRQPQKYVAQRGRFVPWLRSVTRNRAVDALRARRRRFRSETGMADDIGTEAAARDTDDPILPAVRAERRSAIWAAIARLPRRQRQVIALTYFCGLTQREVADNLGLPLGTVKTRVRAAVQRLRPNLQPVDVADAATFGVR